MTDLSSPPSKLLLGNARRGFVGIILGIDIVDGRSSLSSTELESQLIEMGFVEGARVEILHEGAIGRDPIAVRVSGITIALRRREAQSVVVTPVVVRPAIAR